MYKIKTLFILLLCTSCATTYIPPQGPDTAVLIMPVASSKLFPELSDRKVAFAVSGEDGCGKVVKQVPPENRDDEVTKVKIPSNTKIFVKFLGNTGNSICSAAGSFIPETGKVYKVEKLRSYNYCSVGVVLIEDGKKTPIELERAYPDSMSGTTICDHR